MKCKVVEGEVGRGRPSDSVLQSLLHPVLTEDNTCTVQLLNITPEVAGTWEADSDWYEQRAELVIQENIGGVEVVEEQETLVTCRVEGGQPRPQIGFMLMEDQQNKI